MRDPFRPYVSGGYKGWKIKEAPFLFDLPESASHEFASICRRSLYPQGAILFSEGEPARGFFLLCSGRVRLCLNSKSGKTLIVKIARPGDILGLAAFADDADARYKVSAETLQLCQAAFISRDGFARLALKYPAVYRKVIRQLAYYCGSIHFQLRTIGLSHTVSERLAELLLRWSSMGRQTSEGTLIQIPLTHEQIAAFLGTSRETVTRTFRDLKSRHLIAMHGAAVTLLNRSALEQMRSGLGQDQRHDGVTWAARWYPH